MKTVSVYDLYLMAAQLLKDNAEVVEISEGDTYLSFEVPDPNDEFMTIDYDSIEDVSSPDASSSFTVSADSIAPFVTTFNELALTYNALLNTINCCLEELDSKSISADDRSFLKNRLKELETYKNSLEAFLSKFSDLDEN